MKKIKLFLFKLGNIINLAFIEQLSVIIIALICLSSCSSIKYVPIQTEEKVIVRDSIIKVIDTVTVEVPFEIVKEVLPAIDTSVLQTELATSVAYIDTVERKLHHTLEQKGQLKVEIDTCYITKVEERIVYKDRPIEVEVIKYKRDALFWYLLIFQIAVILYLGLRFYLRFK
jgi:hypothetical protein